MSACEEVVMENKRRKSMNHMDPDTKEVHLRLEEWAKWARDIGIAGYPRQSLTEKAATYGRLGIPQEPLHKPELVMPDRVARVDAAICSLGAVDQKAIRLYYLSWAPADVLARKMDRSMRWRQYLNVVRRARWRIAAYLAAIEG
jgi:hypothetical protein